MNLLKQKPKYIFLIDGLGAVFSAIMLGLVLAQLEPLFGIPQKVLYSLAGIAIFLSIYSFSLYSIHPTRWRIFLRILSTANLLYCLLTVFVIYYFFNTITFLGIIYFIIEKIVVVSLASFEWKFSYTSQSSQ